MSRRDIPKRIPITDPRVVDSTNKSLYIEGVK